MGSELESLGFTLRRVEPNFIAPFILSSVDNQTLYLGSKLIHKSTDGGVLWRSMNDGEMLDGNPILSLVGSFQNANVVYAATSPNVSRSHVFQTRDGGESWVDITSELPDRYPTDLAVDPNFDNKVYITFGGFGSSHIFKTNDGGDNWISIDSGLPDVPAWAVAIDPLNPDDIYVGNDLSVYVSTNGGESWQEFSTGLPDAIIAMDLSISLSNHALRVATHGNGVFERKLIGNNIPDPRNNQAVSKFNLKSNYPNPFNSSTTIEYSLRSQAHVVLKIYNVLGQKIRTLVNQDIVAGEKSVVWNGDDDTGQTVKSGIYFYRLQVGEGVETRKMIFLR